MRIELLGRIKNIIWFFTILLFVSIFLASAGITMFIVGAYYFKNVFTFPVMTFGGQVGTFFVISLVCGLMLAFANPEYDAKGMLGIVALSVGFAYIIIFTIIALPIYLYGIEPAPDFWYGNIGKIFLTFPILFFGEFTGVFIYRVFAGE
ncbi:MAG: hypothetical protein ACPL1Y_05595 [Thermoplasmata archaeon]